MRLVDTSAWIEWLIASPAGKALDAMMPAREDWLVPTIVQLELVKWLSRERDEDKADQVIAFTQKCVVVPLSTTIALAAADICARHKLATADAIVYATALEHEADLLTCDAHFEGLIGATYVPKTLTE
jgi:predicted nucleic acid-binding protein